MSAMQFEMRNLCFYEPETDELLQLSYITDIDNKIQESSLINHFGGLRQIGFATNKSFLTLGIYPVFLCYEKNGRTIRAKENVLSEFQKKSGNIYQVSGENIGYIWRMCQKQKAG